MGFITNVFTIYCGLVIIWMITTKLTLKQAFWWERIVRSQSHAWLILLKKEKADRELHVIYRNLMGILLFMYISWKYMNKEEEAIFRIRYEIGLTKARNVRKISYLKPMCHAQIVWSAGSVESNEVFQKLLELFFVEVLVASCGGGAGRSADVLHLLDAIRVAGRSLLERGGHSRLHVGPAAHVLVLLLHPADVCRSVLPQLRDHQIVRERAQLHLQYIYSQICERIYWY